MLRYLLALVLLFSTCGSSFASTVNVFFAGGQSNAKPAWAAAISETLQASGKFDNVLMVHSMHSGNWLHLWYNTAPAANYQTDFFNSSGTGLLEQSLSDITASGNDYVFSGLFWFQGEGDTGSTYSQQHYAERYMGMMSQLASDIGQDFNFVVAIIAANPTYEADLFRAGREWEDVDAIRQTQFSLSDHGAVFDTFGYARSDLWHLTLASQEAVGAGMANTYLNSFAQVPIPSAIWLLLSGLSGLLGVKRRAQQ